MSNPRRPLLKHILRACGVASVLMALSSVSTVHALPITFPEGSLIHDAEIEDVLRQFTDPILKKAGIDPSSVQLILVATPVVNAATSIGKLIFVNTGMLTYCETADELAAVLAHEIGHMHKHHVIKFLGAMDDLSKVGWGGLGLGVLVAALSGNPAALMMGLGAGQHLATRSLLHFSRSQESQADLASFELLTSLHWPIEGSVTLMQRLKEDSGPMGDARIVYSQTHPLHQDRIRMAQNRLQPDHTLPPQMVTDFKRIQEKIMAYTTPASHISKALNPHTHLYAAAYPKAFKGSSKGPYDGTYARVIGLYRQGSLAQALDALASLETLVPTCYLEEFRAQILLELGQVDQAAHAIDKAISHAKHPHMSVHLLAAQIYIKQETPPSFQKARHFLDKILQSPFPDPQAWYFLSIIQGKMGQRDLMNLSLAEYAVATGDIKRAAEHITLALKKLPKGTPAYRRAEDLMAQLKLAKERAP